MEKDKLYCPHCKRELTLTTSQVGSFFSQQRWKNESPDLKHLSEIGKKGAEARWRKVREQQAKEDDNK